MREFFAHLRRRDWLAGFFLLVITVIAYQPVWHAGFIWDDVDFLMKSPVIKRSDGLCRIWFTASTPDYYPMTWSMIWLEWHVWGDNPLGYHLVNVLLHACNAVLLWRALQRLKIPGALLAAAIFALHPVNVESVAWVSEGKNALCMFFYAATLLAWLKFEDSGRGRWYGAAFAGYALALFSKSAVATLPLVLLGLAWWRRGRVEWKDVRRTAPFFVITAALCCVTVWFHEHLAIGPEIVRTDGFWSRLAGAGWAVWFYLYKAVLPLNLDFIYPRWQINARNVFSYIPLVVLAAAFAFCWRFRLGWGKALFFGLAYFVVMLLPILGFLNIYFMRYSLVADHWQYFAIISPIALAATLLIRRPVVAVALLLALGILTWQQCRMYANDETLWQTTLRRNPGCWMAHGNLARIYNQQGLTDEAFAHFQKALEINPGDAEAHSNFGVALEREDRVDEAIAQYRQALQINPKYVQAHNKLGHILFSLGNVDEAISQFRQTLQIDSANEIAHNNLGIALAQKGLLDEAITQFQQALQINPGNERARNNLNNALWQKGSAGQSAK